MAISWGSWDYGNSSAGFRVGLEVTRTSVSHSSTSVTYTVKVYVEAMYNVNDTITVSYSGGISGSTTGNLTTGTSGGYKLWATKTYTYNYGSTSYGSSPGSVTFRADLSGVYNGANPYRSMTYSLPARPYAAPAAPTSVAAARNSDAQATVTWVNRATAGEPYTSLLVQKRELTGSTWSAWSTVGTTSSAATSLVVTGLSSNHAYQFQVRANNSVGSSAFVTSNSVLMTPASPTGVSSRLDASGSTVTTTWSEDTYGNSGITFTIQRSVGGAAYTTVVSGLPFDTRSWTDPTPGAGTNQYRVAAVQATGSLSSAYATGNTVSTIVAPLAPTQLSPNGKTVDLANDLILSWKHNDGGDGAAQSKYSIRYSSNGGTTWTQLGIFTGTASQHTLVGGTLTNGLTYLWQVQTQGIASAGWGALSASATIVGSTTPTATLSSPPATVTTLPILVEWAYNQDESSPQTAWEAQLVRDSTGVVASSASGSDGATSTEFSGSKLIDGEAYTARVRVRSGAGLWSEWAETAFVVDLLPPVGVNTSGTFDPETGTVVLSLDPEPYVLGQNLLTNPNFRTAGADVEVRRNLLTNPAFVGASPVPGWTGLGEGGVATQISPYSGNAGGLAVGTQITAAVDVTALAGSLTVVVAAFPTTGGVFGANPHNDVNVVIPAGQTVRIKDSFTIPAGADGARLYVTVKAGDYTTMKLARGTLEVGITDGSYFDGASAAADGLVYSWTGAANASASIATGQGVYGTYASSDGSGKLWRVPGGGANLLHRGSNYTIFNFPQLSPLQVGPEQVTYGFDVVSDVDVEITHWAEFGGGAATRVYASTQLVAGVPQRIVVTATDPHGAVTSGNIYVSVGFHPPGDSTGVTGKITVSNTILSEGVTDGAYLDGSMADTSEVVYEWQGDPDNSTSVATVAGRVSLESVTVERRVEGGEWETLIEGLQVPTDLLDVVPLTNGENTYRVTSVSATPTYLENPELVVTADPQGWVFVNYGADLTTLLRFRTEPKVSESAGRESALVKLLGRKKPVALYGEGTDRKVNVSGVLLHDPTTEDGGLDSPPSDWRDAAQQAGIACLRDFTGRRVFGVLSDVAVADTAPGEATVGFSVTESDR